MGSVSDDLVEKGVTEKKSQGGVPPLFGLEGKKSTGKGWVQWVKARKNGGVG